MIQTLFPFLPSEMSAVGSMAALAGAGVGVALWLFGSRFSRTLVTLLAVSLGMVVGIQLPQWLDWGIQGWAMGVIGAIVFGVTGYAWHKIWVGTSLGLVLAVWAAVSTLAYYGVGSLPEVTVETAIEATKMDQWVAPALTEGMNSRSWFIAVWNSLGETTRKVLPFACLAALLSGMGAAAAWPRIGMVLLYSTLGLTLLVGLGIAAVVGMGHQDWLGPVPRTMTSQVVVLLALVAFGAIFQWRSVPAQLVEDRPPKADEFEHHNG
jgi:hypothetical protein